MTTNTRSSTKEEKRAQRLVKKLGGAKEVHERLVAFTHRVELVESQRKVLTKRYPDKWIVIADGEIVTFGDSLETVLRELDDRGISRSDAVVEFLSTKPRNMLL